MNDPAETGSGNTRHGLDADLRVLMDPQPGRDSGAGTVLLPGGRF